MEIQRSAKADLVELTVSGRLDANGAVHLEREFSESLREGAHHVKLLMSGVDYLSSAGIRILISCSKQLRPVKGSFRISSPSDQVYSVLKMVGLLELLEVSDSDRAKPDAPVCDFTITPETGGNFSVTRLATDATLSLSLYGLPDRLNMAEFTVADLMPLSTSSDLLAVGLGAFGTDFEECRHFFGEFMALAGAAVCLPADGSQLPDFQLSKGMYVPTVQTLYAAACKGKFSHFFNFRPDETARSLSLSQIVQAALSIANKDSIGIVIIAESEGLVGASLKIPPVEQTTSPFSFPEVRDWLSFTTEPDYSGTLTLVAGIATTAPDRSLAPFVRPLYAAQGVSGHFHAAALSYRALPDGPLDLSSTVSDVFETQNLLGMLHLLGDNREISGTGESRFKRGAVWAGPIHSVTQENCPGAL